MAKVPHGHWKTLTLSASLHHNSIVVLEILGNHTGSCVRKLLRAAGIKLLFLPPYSPDLNLIDEMFSNLKRLNMPQSKSERL